MWFTVILHITVRFGSLLPINHSLSVGHKVQNNHSRYVNGTDLLIIVKLNIDDKNNLCSCI